jgi:hemerythrin
MPKFEWTEQHSVCFPEIDEEHQMIFKLCRNLQRALAGRCPIAQVHSLVGELAVHSLEHFWHEEHQMRATGYSFYTWHKQQHRTARSRMHVLEGRIRDGDRGAARELLTFMQYWLNDHIRLTDRMLGAHLRNHLRELTAKAS